MRTTTSPITSRGGRGGGSGSKRNRSRDGEQIPFAIRYGSIRFDHRLTWSSVVSTLVQRR